MYTIGISLHFQDTYDQEVARGLIEWAKERPEWRLIGPIGGMMDLRPHTRQKLDALVVRVEHEGDVRKYEHLTIPVIDIAGAFEHERFHRVQNDDRETGIVAGNLIRDLGALSFAYVGVKNTLWSQLRLTGLEEALSQALPPERVFNRALPFYKNPSESGALHRFLSSLQLPCAVFCCNDIAAVKVTQHLLTRGRNIPREVSVVSVDNDPLLCSLAHPSLTSIALDCRAIGYRSGELIAELVHASRSPSSPIYIPPSGIIERESTRMMVGHDHIVVKALLYIREYAHLGISVDDVAHHCGTSRRNLELKWRKMRNQSLHDQIVNERLKRAKRLLREGNATIETVAAESGFRTTQRMYAQFRLRVGCTPGQWRVMSGLSN